MQKSMKLTDQQLKKAVEARDAKQRYTKGGNPLGKTPKQKQDEVLLFLCQAYELKPETAIIDYGSETITGELLNIPETGSSAVDTYRAQRDVPVAVVSSSQVQEDPTLRLDAKNYVAKPAANTALIPLTEEEKAQLKVFDDMYDRSLAILQICNDQVIEDEPTRALGFSVAKQTDDIIKELDSRRLQLNKKPKKEIDDRNALVKKLTTPLEAGLATIKKRLTDYQVAAEQKRLKEQQEQKQKEEAQRLKDEAEKERIKKINTSIQDFRTKADQEIAAIDTLEKLDAFIKKISSWKPKQDFYQEFFQLILDEMKSAIMRAEARRSIVKQLEASAANEAENAKLKAELKAKQDQEAQQKAKELEQAKQFEAACKLTITTKLQGQGWPPSEIEKQLEYALGIYGDFKTAVEKVMDFSSRFSVRFQDYQQSLQLDQQKAKNLRTTWKYRVTDLNQVPREYLQLDEKKLTNYLSSKKEAIKAGAQEVQIPGIEFYSQTDATLAS